MSDSILSKTKSFIEKATIVHKGRYTYDRFRYLASHIKGVIKCPVHGNFEQFPHNHLKGHGCRKCSHVSKTPSRKIFLQKAKKKHNNYYSYNNFRFVDVNTRGRITCPVHGDFLQRPVHHLSGSGCRKCKQRRLSQSQFIERSAKKHSNQYTYDKVVYVNSKTKVIITCPAHGDFIQRPFSHMTGSGCPRCDWKIKLALKKQQCKDITNFVVDAKRKFNYRYSYDTSSVPDDNKECFVICPIHGRFSQNMEDHLEHGCSFCNDLQIFIKISRIVFGKSYSYDKFVWVKEGVEGCITCPLHGDFHMTAEMHTRKREGCPECEKIIAQRARKISY